MTAAKDVSTLDGGALLASKLKPPRLRYVLDRPRLLRLATPAEKQSLVLICAGPGFGKTTLMAQIARYHPGGSVWYQVDSLDRDPAVFLRHLILGISQACGGEVCKRSMSRLREASDAGREGVSVLAVLADELGEKLDTPLAICFDDFHLFDGTVFAAEFMKCLIAELPHQCTVYISSRTQPRIKLGRMRSQGLVLEVASGDLQFSRKELEKLLSETWDLKADAETLALLHKNTEGWAAGLVLAEDHLRSGNAVPELFSGRKVRRNVYEYLAEEVLGRQSEQLRDLLEKSALINPVDPHICQKALGAADAPALLAAAEKMNLFTTQVGDSDLYRYHPLFRKNLLARLNERLGAGEIQELRARFGAAFEGEGEKKQAVEQYLKSGQEQKAAGLIEDIGRGMIKGGEHVTLERWLHDLRESLSPALEMYRGKLLLLAGKPQDSLNLLRAVKSHLTTGDKELICDIAASIAECFRMLGKHRDGIKEIKPLLKLDLSSDIRLNLLFRLSSCYWHDYDEEGFQNCVRETKKLACDNPTFHLLYKVDIMRAIDCLRSGVFLEARRRLSAAVEIDEIDANDKNLCMNNLAACLMMMGRYEESMELAELCMATVLRQKDGKRLRLIYDTYGCTLAALGNWGEGKLYIERSINVGNEFERDLVESCLPRCHLGTYARRRGEYSSAVDFHSESLSIAKAVDARYEMAMSVLNLGADLLRTGQYAKAKKQFSQACKLAFEPIFGYVLTQVDFHRAWAAHVTGDKTQELESLSAALTRSNKYQHNHFIIQEGKISLPLFTTALNHGIETDYVFWILERIGPPSLSVVASVLENERKDIRAKCARLLGAIADPNSISLARKMLRDSDEEVRSEARKALKSLREQIKSPHELLTQREAQVLEMIADGAANGQIAEQLFISERTVKAHITNMFRKLGLTTRLEAALYYQKSLQKNTTL